MSRNFGPKYNFFEKKGKVESQDYALFVMQIHYGIGETLSQLTKTSPCYILKQRVLIKAKFTQKFYIEYIFKTIIESFVTVNVS